MRKTTTPLLTGVLVAALAFSGYYLYKQQQEIKVLKSNIEELQAAGTACCGDSVTPTYSSISYAEFEENVNYFRESIGTNTIDVSSETKSLWMSMNEMQNYLCVVRQHAEELSLDTDSLGLRIYFIRYTPQGNQYDNKLSVAFIPTFKGKTGTPQDFDSRSLQAASSSFISSGTTFIMNRIMPCPVNCDGVLLP